MRKIASILLIAIISVSCNNSTTENATDSRDTVIKDTTTTTISATDSVLSGCYSMINGRDSASLQLQLKGANVTGSLRYNLFQKDRNDGTFQGEVNGDLLNVWYMFRSEGMMSVRQEIFRISSNKLTPANGEIKVTNDTARFADPSKLRFDSARAFVKVACEI